MILERIRYYGQCQRAIEKSSLSNDVRITHTHTHYICVLAVVWWAWKSAVKLLLIQQQNTNFHVRSNTKRTYIAF